MLRSPHNIATRPTRRRGVVLIFTVAVLVLLAVIATAYLATARIDRVYLDTKGGPAVGTTFSIEPPLEEMRLDLFDWSGDPDAATPVGPKNDDTWRYRPADGFNTASNTYRNWDFLAEVPALANDTAALFRDRLMSDPWLASRVPLPYNTGGFNEAGGTAFYPAWPVISRWVERWDDTGWVFDGLPNNIGFFESPQGPITNSPFTGTPRPPTYRDRHAAIPTYTRINYGSAVTVPPAVRGKTRVYPSLTFGTNTYLAGDADGDGVADAGLFPLDFWTGKSFGDQSFSGTIYDPADTSTHSTRWYAAVRIVDNSASINVNTAWRRDFDVRLTASGGSTDPTPFTVVPTNAEPNYGIFRSNIGLLELMRETDPALLDTQWQRFASYRFGNRAFNTVNWNTGRADYNYYTASEALEMNIGRRPQIPGGAGGAFQSFDKSLNGSLAFLNGMVNPREPRSALETALYRDVYHNTTNWGATDLQDTEKETRSFTFFSAPTGVPVGSAPPYSPLFWWHGLYNPNTADRGNYFTTNFGGHVAPARSLRYLLTAANPQSTAMRPLGEPVPGTPGDELRSPKWVTDTDGTPGTTAMATFKDGIKAKASINTDPFGVLWRGFYQALADPNATASPAAPADLGAAGSYAAGTQQSLYVRSALAAVNAMDMRDADDDITTYRIKPGTGTDLVVVAGGERQLFISRVDAAGGAEINVTLINPYPNTAGLPVFTANAAAYKLAIIDGGTIRRVGNIGAGTVAPGATIMLTIDPDVTDTTGDLVLLRTRNADGTTSNGTTTNPYNEATSDADWVPVDIVRINGNPDTVAISYGRSTTDWTRASTGRDHTDPLTDAVSNPIALDNMPGPRKMDPAAPNFVGQFPFGAFARNGDMMLVPFVGSFSQASGGALTRVVPMTLDVQAPTIKPTITSGQIQGRFTPVPATAATDWRSRLFDNFTTLANPMNAYMPNIAPVSWPGTNPPTKVSDSDTPPEDTIPAQGLININTASREVLEMVPFATDTSGNRDVNKCNDIINDILTRRRTGAGPFKSVIELMTLPNFNMGTAPNDRQGNFLPTDISVSAYAQNFHSFNRVSNLLTTRSDSFTVYVLLQQWQDFGTAAPVLIPESDRRFAVVVDRSRIYDGNDSRAVTTDADARGIEYIDQQSFAAE